LTALVASADPLSCPLPLLRENFDALMDAERHLVSADRAPDALKVLDVIFDSFLKRLSVWGSVESEASSDILTLRHEETGLLSQMPASGVVDDDNKGTDDKLTAVQCMLRHSRDKLRRRFLVAASRRFPSHDSLKALLALNSVEHSGDSINGQAVLLLKDLIVNR
jgi:hypothetical protein